MNKATALMTDEELMQRIIDRDRNAFSILYDRYSDKLMGYFMKMLWRNRELSDYRLQ